MSSQPASLPAGARRRLTAALRSRITLVPEIRDSARSIPLVRHTWEARLAGLRLILKQLDAALEPDRFASESWAELSEALGTLAAVRHELLAMLVALAPFDARDIRQSDATKSVAQQIDEVGIGVELLSAYDAAIDAVLDDIEAGKVPRRLGHLAFAHELRVPTVALAQPGEVLAVTFAMDTVPVDADGAFSASKVFEAYKYDNSRLLGYLVAHLRSLGVDPVDDMLAMVSIAGWIASAPDAVLAWQSFREMTLRLRHQTGSKGAATSADAATAPAVLTDSIAHLGRRDEALRQGRRMIQLRIKEFLLAEDTEIGAHALADAYGRLLDGPVREYAWAIRRLRLGSWEPTATVGQLADAFKNDPWLAPAVVPMLFPDIRNGRAHEDLVWDGKRQVFVVDGSDIALKRVDIAVADAMSFTLGCEAALAYWNATHVEHGAVAPGPDQPGRMAAWRRAEALVGTNGLGLISYKHNARTADIRVERLHRQDINPALQCLVMSRLLLPDVDTFAVFTNEAGGPSEPVITVSSAALDATFPVWVKAREGFDSMPLSAFLPANLDARLRDEDEPRAARAAAWIALDDALSAIDEHPGRWTAEDIWVTKTRVDIARFALLQCSAALDDKSLLDNAHQVLDGVFSDLQECVPERTDESTVDQLDSVMKLRSAWTTLGPVARLPRVTEARDDLHPGYWGHAGRRRTSTPFDRFTSM